jgi:hypothetical protein
LIVQESPSLSYILAIPSIINGDLTHVDVLQILQNQEFVSHLLENTPDAYNNTSFDTDGIVNFAPDSIIVWE